MMVSNSIGVNRPRAACRRRRPVGCLRRRPAATPRASAGHGLRGALPRTPLILGVTYLLAAVIDGPRGGYWATGLGLTGWGVAVAFMGEVRPTDIDPAGAYLVGAGLAGVAAGLLRARGFLVSEIGLAATIAAGGLLLALTPRAPDTLDDATTYAIALAIVGGLNVAGGVVGLRRPGTKAPGMRSRRRTGPSSARRTRGNE